MARQMKAGPHGLQHKPGWSQAHEKQTKLPTLFICFRKILNRASWWRCAPQNKSSVFFSKEGKSCCEGQVQLLEEGQGHLSVL